MHEGSDSDSGNVSRELAIAIEQAADSSRRGFVRGAVLYAMAVASGIGLSACGGGGGDGGGAGGGGFGGVGSGGGGSVPGSDAGSFQHGVASGDPLSDRVILWTRLSGTAPAALSVRWEVASDANFGVIVAGGVTTTDPQQDFTVKVDAAGLEPASVYYYRFYYGAVRSPIGRTKTLPVGSVAQVKLAVLSCSNFPLGYFNVYAEVAKRNDIDAVLHLGDYIYEHGVEGFASLLAFAVDRESDPGHEILTLSDYRRRYAQYRTDQDLRALHASAPMIVVWDDHELANNAWSSGAANHDPTTEGPFAARRAAAIQAYREWLPIRMPDPNNPLKIYRSFDFGSLVSLHMLDTRLIGREQQVNLQQYLGGAAASASRQMLGAEQSSWLSAQMNASSAIWQVLGQQVLMARMEIPLSVASVFSSDTLTEYVEAQATPSSLRTESQRALVNQQRVPYNLDAWDGYPAARESVLAAARSANKNLVSLAGDTHNAWASNLTDSAGQRVGVEFATASVSSPGFELLRPLISSDVLADGFTKMVRDLRYAETSRRGYLVVTLTPAVARADWIAISTVFSHSYAVTAAKSLRALPGAGNLEVLPV